jgi:uncharacterized membrane protein required for colicin V production
MVVDIVCGALLLVFGLFGVFKGFARQIFKFVSFFAAIIGAFLLVRLAFDFLYGFDFFRNWLDAMSKAFDVEGKLGGLGTKIVDYAAKYGKKSGELLAEYTMNAILFVVLAIFIGLAFKLLKKIVFPIADMPVINVFDRLLGLALGLVWAAAIIIGLMLLMNYAIAPNVKAVADWWNKTLEGSPVVGKYVWKYIDKIGEWLYGTIQFLAGQIKLAVK